MALDILIAFLAPFAGVFGAFLLNRAWERHSDSESKMRLLSDLRDELISCKDHLTGEGHHLPTSIWSSAVASGELMLLDARAKRGLSYTYHSINGANYEADRCRDVGEEVRKEGLDRLENVAKAKSSEILDYYLRLTSRLTKTEQELRQLIDSILRESWWPHSD